MLKFKRNENGEWEVYRVGKGEKPVKEQPIYQPKTPRYTKKTDQNAEEEAN